MENQINPSGSVQHNKYNKLAVAGFILSLGGAIAFVIGIGFPILGIIGLIAGLAGLVLGIVALTQIATLKRAQQIKQRGKALAILAIVGVILWPIVLGFIFGLVTSIIFGTYQRSQVQTETTSSDWKTYVNSKYDYQISYPYNESTIRPVGFSTQSDPRLVGIFLNKGLFPNISDANLKITTQRGINASGFSAEYVCNSGASNLKSVTINGMEFKKLSQTGAGPSALGSRPYILESYSIMGGNTCYDITLFVEAQSQPENKIQFEKPLSKLEEILNTFKFTNE